MTQKHEGANFEATARMIETMDIEEGLYQQIAGGPEQAPLEPTDVVAAARGSKRIRLLVALTGDQAIHAEWARQTEWADLDRPGKAAWMRAELPEVEEEIDRQLDSDSPGETIELLARNDIAWRHDALPAALDDDATRSASALILARSTPQALRPALLECDVVAEVVEMLRAAAAAGADELWDQFLVWRARLSELDEVDEPTREEATRRLDCIGACLEPTLYARGLLAGDYAANWVEDPVCVSDFLESYGPTDWLEVVAALEMSQDPGLELASTIAVAAAAGIGEAPPKDEEIEELFELLSAGAESGDEHNWETLATRLGFGFQIALGEDELALLLSQAAAHERLVTFGVHSPGIPGLPLSPTADDYVDAGQLADIVGEIAGSAWDDSTSVRALRTLLDARDWKRRDPALEESLRTVAAIFENRTEPSIEIARAQLLASLDEARLMWERNQFESSPELRGALILAGAVGDVDADPQLLDILKTESSGETPRALDCARHLASIGRVDALEQLGDLWLSDAPVLRAPFIRELIEETIAVHAREGSEEATPQD